MVVIMNKYQHEIIITMITAKDTNKQATDFKTKYYNKVWRLPRRFSSSFSFSMADLTMRLTAYNAFDSLCLGKKAFRFSMPELPIFSRFDKRMIESKENWTHTHMRHLHSNTVPNAPAEPICFPCVYLSLNFCRWMESNQDDLRTEQETTASSKQDSCA